MVSIALVGRTPIVREGLAHILSQGGFVIACAVNSAADLGPAMGEEVTGLGLILIENADCTCLAAQVAALHRRFPSARVAIIADAFDFGAMVGAIRAGVDGFIVAEMSCECLIESLKLIAMGERLLPSQLADNLPILLSDVDRQRPSADLAGPGLSPREVEIMRCLVTGCQNKSIALRLDISEAAVKMHIKAVLRKIPACNRTQAAIWAAHHGLTAFSDAEHEAHRGDRVVAEATALREAPELLVA